MSPDLSTAPADTPNRPATRGGGIAVDDAADTFFVALACQAREACGMPIGVLCLTDVHRNWLSTRADLTGLLESLLEIALRGETMSGNELQEVEDARLDPRLEAEPSVAGPPYIRSWAALPVWAGGGTRAGTLVVMGLEPARLTFEQTSSMRALAVLAGHALDMLRAQQVQAQAERGLAAKALAESEAYHRALLDEQTEMVSLSAPGGSLVYVNPAYARHFGRRPPEMLGVSLYDFIEPADRQAVRRVLESVRATGVAAYNENRMRAANGSERWVAWTNSVRIDTGGQRLLHSVGHDITQRKHAEIALHASQTFLERTGRVAGVGGWELDLVSGRLTWSDETRRLHEVEPDYQPTLEQAVDFYAPEARPTIEAAVRRSMLDGSPWDVELPFVTAKGRQIWVRAVGEAEFVDGQAVRLLGAFQDVTERRRLEQQVTEDERFLRQLTDSLPLRIAYLDRERRYRFVNREFLRSFGLNRTDVIGRTRAEIRPDADQATLAQRAEAALAGAAQQFEFEEVVSGQTRRFENRLIPDRDEAHAVRGFFVTGIDITERVAAERALRELTMIIDNTTDFVVQTDARGQILYMNPSARSATGLRPDTPIGQLNFADFNTEATSELFARTILPALKTTTVWLGETTLNLAGRPNVPASHMVIAHRDAGGRIARFSAVMRDISAAAAAKQEVSRQTTTLRSVTEAIQATVAVVDINGVYRFVNGAFERWCGLPRERVVGHAAGEVLGPDELERRRPWMARAYAGEAVDFTLEYPGQNGVRFLALSYVPLRLDAGSIDGIVVVTYDVTEQKREEERLLQLAQRDPLTGLLNRAGFEKGLDLLLRPADRHGLAVLYIDLDDFKPVNDMHGHPTGDRVLEMFSRRLVQLVRPTDLVGRLGGDEFAIALVGLRDEAPATMVSDKVLAAACEPFLVDAHSLTLSASVGYAFSADSNWPWRALVVQADANLLAAKRSGKGRQLGSTG